MVPRNFRGVLFIVAACFAVSGQAKVYSNVKVGKYTGRTVKISECKDTTFLACMMNKVYPLMRDEAENRTSGQHIDGVKAGEGVELRLTEDATTYHVKYKAEDEDKAERSGRSFAGVGRPSRSGVVAYVADASDAYYLDSLEKVGEDEEQLKAFYEAILKVIVNSDASGFDALETFTKQVATDFVAVMVAEQYRHLLGGEGKLGPTFNWDDALLQVTLLAAFHAGQTKTDFGMFYEGEFTNEVFDQRYDVKENGEEVSYCLYQKPWKRDELKAYEEGRKKFENDKRANTLRDYWQFNRDCTRSGINLTRKDFSLMGEAITAWADKTKSDTQSALAMRLDAEDSTNMYSSIAKFFISNSQEESLSDDADELVGDMVAYLMDVKENAVTITKNLKKKR